MGIDATSFVISLPAGDMCLNTIIRPLVLCEEMHIAQKLAQLIYNTFVMKWYQCSNYRQQKRIRVE